MFAEKCNILSSEKSIGDVRNITRKGKLAAYEQYEVRGSGTYSWWEQGKTYGRLKIDWPSPSFTEKLDTLSIGKVNGDVKEIKRKSQLTASEWYKARGGWTCSWQVQHQILSMSKIGWFLPVGYIMVG